jgi:cytochrome c biogenesis protein CcdA
MKTTLCMALVVNAAFYVLQQLCRIYFSIMEPLVAFGFPQYGSGWFRSYTLGFVIIGFGLLLWTACLPAGRSLLSRISHIVLIMMAALNLVFAVTIHGLLATVSESKFADTPENQSQRAKHARRSQPNDFRNP